MPTQSDDLDVLRQQTEDALDRAEREPDRQSRNWNELTPVINVNVAQQKPGSDPPSSRRTNGRLLGIAAIITALGGAAGVQQCAGQARQSVPAIKPNGPKL